MQRVKKGGGKKLTRKRKSRRASAFSPLQDEKSRKIITGGGGGKERERWTIPLSRKGIAKGSSGARWVRWIYLTREEKKKKKTVYISNLLNSYSYLLVRVRQEWSN